MRNIILLVLVQLSISTVVNYYQKATYLDFFQKEDDNIKYDYHRILLEIKNSEFTVPAQIDFKYNNNYWKVSEFRNFDGSILATKYLNDFNSYKTYLNFIPKQDGSNLRKFYSVIWTNASNLPTTELASCNNGVLSLYLRVKFFECLQTADDFYTQNLEANNARVILDPNGITVRENGGYINQIGVGFVYSSGADNLDSILRNDNPTLNGLC